MNALIKIQDSGRISAKDLYGFLELDKSNFIRWCKMNIQDNQFASENTDYLRLVTNDETPTGGKIQRTDYSLSIDFAKKLCMISKSPRGEEARDYFIEVEKRYKEQLAQLPDFTDPAAAARAWADQFEKRITAEKQNAILMHVNKTYTMTEIAKELNMRSASSLNKKLSDMKIQFKQNGTWVLYSKYSSCGYEEIKQEVLDSGHIVYHRKITQRGREFILSLLTA
ncbi:antA/AntB antirepressor family protein [Pectinatus frisingensis]|uniref:antA/AntB antirepressor family protein n=1 Tax=Pectinatus frisingensis TaxID=865 RepID=UPI0018C7D036|nr:antA/AntB antirepressor family protein [Pectinatus frisingensis]